MASIKELNERLITVRFGNGVLIYCIIQVMGVLLIYKQTKYNLVSPLIPSYVTCEVFGYYVDGGLIMSFAVLLMVIAKLYKQNLLISLIGVFAIVGQQIILASIK